MNMSKAYPERDHYKEKALRKTYSDSFHGDDSFNAMVYMYAFVTLHTAQKGWATTDCWNSHLFNKL